MHHIRVTMNQLAKQAGVHVSTVSRALRGQSSIPEETRRRIQALAEKMGYQPDPVLDALCAYRKRVAGVHHRPTLAIIATNPDWQKDLANRLYFDGARQRAQEQGYQAEVFVMTPTRLNCRRLAGILTTRGIKGIIVLPLAGVNIPLDFPWDRFFVVATGYKLQVPGISRVSINHFGAMGETLQRVHDLGYRRPGLVLQAEGPHLAPDGASHVSKLWEGGYLAQAPKHFENPVIPVVRPSGTDPFETWLKTYQPDLLISQRRDLAAVLPTWASGLRIVYTMVDDDASLTGIHQNSIHVGRHAVDLLVGSLYREAPPSPAVPVTVLVDSRWQDGAQSMGVAHDRNPAKRTDA